MFESRTDISLGTPPCYWLVIMSYKPPSAFIKIRAQENQFLVLQIQSSLSILSTSFRSKYQSSIIDVGITPLSIVKIYRWVINDLTNSTHSSEYLSLFCSLYASNLTFKCHFTRSILQYLMRIAILIIFRTRRKCYGFLCFMITCFKRILGIHTWNMKMVCLIELNSVYYTVFNFLYI